MENIRCILVFCLGLLLLNWPVLSIAGSREADDFFLYLFSVWIFLIVLIFANGLIRPDFPSDLPEDPGSCENSAAPDSKEKSLSQTGRADHV
ncbi:MAG: hypothetical protein R2941_08590 [Desulfobacterales bacterium]